MINMEPHLPTEIIDYIIYLSDLETAIKCDNNFIVKKYLVDNQISWEDILYQFNGTVITYLYNNNINIKELQEFQSSFIPIYHPSIFESAIKNNDLFKMEMLEKLLPKSIIDKELFEYAKQVNYTEIINWIQINRPVFFINNYTKHPSCLKINPETVKKFPLDIQKIYSITKCSCLKCGGNGKGFNN